MSSFRGNTLFPLCNHCLGKESLAFRSRVRLPSVVVFPISLGVIILLDLCMTGLATVELDTLEAKSPRPFPLFVFGVMKGRYS